MDYMTTIEASKLWGISTRRITKLCNEGRITGASLMGRTWIIPKSSLRPEELRRGRKKQI